LTLGFHKNVAPAKPLICMTHQHNIRGEYQQKIDEYTGRLNAFRRQDVWLGRLRVITFLPALALGYYGLFQASEKTGWFVATAFLVAAFVVVVRLHERILRAAEEHRQRLEISRIQVARLGRRWDTLPVVEIEVPSGANAVADDLDLFGSASLFQLVSQAHTPFGRDTLRDWLLVAATPEEILDRQQAVVFLAKSPDVREEICLRGRMLSASSANTLPFVEWAEGEPLLSRRSWLVWVPRIFAAIVLAAAVALAGRVVDPTAAFLVIAAVAILNLIVIVAFGGRVYDVLDRIGARSHDIRQYRPLFETIAALPRDVPFFAKLQANVGRTAHERVEALAGLMRLVRFAQLRRDGLFGVPYYLSQLFLLTDFHVVASMERWQRRHGSAVRGWLKDIGRAEAISSLGTLAHDNPHWCMPAVDQRQGTTLVATQIGHPLLADDICARNDVEIGPASTFVLVTGSNMSGKSTLLRSVGLNVILAQAGSPVCAQEFRTPPVQLATSMRMRDSLAGGVSFFMAELRRLKEIVDQSRDCQRQSQLCLYLLDEILQGTNSTERHIAVSRIIGHLVEQGSIGMVSTHDLELATTDALKDASRTVHFRESITGDDNNEQMTFDYVLRPGLSPTTNALKLLKFVGLSD
jgi:hypothetical protein